MADNDIDGERAETGSKTRWLEVSKLQNETENNNYKPTSCQTVQNYHLNTFQSLTTIKTPIR